MSGARLHGFRRWAKDLLWPSAVIASIVHLLSAAHMPLELPTRIGAEMVAYSYDADDQMTSDARSSLALVEIGLDEFRGRYEGKSPLDRCQLADDLAPILKNPNIETVAVDLYLAPRYSRQQRDLECQAALDTLVRSHIRKLILVVGPDDGEWARKLGPDARLASPDLQAPLGIVMDHFVEARSPGLGTMLALSICGASPRNGLNPPDFCAHAVRNGGARFEHDGEAGYERNAISLRALRELNHGGTPLNIRDTCLQPGAEDCGIRHVLIGAGFSGDDRHLTSAGRWPGVRIHAAIAAQPRSHTPHHWGFIADVALGALVIGPLVQLTWRRYFEQRLGQYRSTARWFRHQRLAYVYLLLLAFWLLLLVGALFVLSLYLYARFQFWISPVPMALGMAIESLVTGSVHTALHLLEHGRAAEPDSARLSPAQQLVAWAPKGIALTLLATTILDLSGAF